MVYYASQYEEYPFVRRGYADFRILFGQHLVAVMQIQATFSISSICTTLAGYPSVNNTVDTIVSHLVDVGTVRYEMGYASAISVFLFALMAITRIVVGKLLHLVGS